VRALWATIALAVAIIGININGAHAQYFKRCYEPSEPSIPSGYYEERYEMEAAQDEYRQYVSEVEDYLDCLKRNSREAVDSVERLSNELDAAVDAYNSR